MPCSSKQKEFTLTASIRETDRWWVFGTMMVYMAHRKESPGKKTDYMGVPTQVVLDTHNSGLYLLVSCQNSVCDFHIARIPGL